MKIDLRLGDCLEVMATIPSSSIDLIFTSPPYNLSTTTGGRTPFAKGKWHPPLEDGYASHDDKMPYVDYVDWQKRVLTECWRLLSENGAIYYNHKPRIQNGLLQTPLDLNPGLPVRQIVIWKRAGGINFSPTFYLPTHEWIVIFAKPDFRLRNKACSGAKDVWEVTQESNNIHPAPFPVALPRIALETTSARVVLDPFVGSGSTALACIEMERDFIGIDNDASYLALAAQRIAKAQQPAIISWP